jgi:hypothetical protein
VRPFVQASFCLVFAAALYGADQLAAVRADLQHLAIDPSETWRVRDLELSKGGT